MRACIHRQTAAVYVNPADSVSIGHLLHYDSIAQSVIHTIRQTENCPIANSTSFWCLWGFNACLDGFPDINIFKVTQEFPQNEFLTVSKSNTRHQQETAILFGTN